MTKEAKKTLRSHAANIVFGVAVFAAALGVWFATSAFGAPSADAVAVVHDSDGAATELPLSQDTTMTFATEKGTNVVEVRDGAVRVVSADCANHDCVEQGSISSSGRQIVCLPHELWIEVVEAESGAEDRLDVVGS